jgi:hypothetical protein
MTLAKYCHIHDKLPVVSMINIMAKNCTKLLHTMERSPIMHFAVDSKHCRGCGNMSKINYMLIP